MPIRAEYNTLPFWEQVLKKEDELLLSDEGQNILLRAEMENQEEEAVKIYMMTLTGLKKQILRDFEVPEEKLDKALLDMKEAPNRWPKELKPLCMYHRHNRIREGDLQPGTPVPSSIQLIDLGGRPQDLMHGNKRLLVIFAGSYSCPVVRGQVPIMLHLAKIWAHAVKFRFVYIAEAHAREEWPINNSRYNPVGGNIVMGQTQTSSDRCAAAKRFQAIYGIDATVLPMLVDPPETNSFEAAFPPWPLRWFLVERGLGAGKPDVLLQKALPFNGTYNFAEVDKLLRKCCADAPGADAPPMPEVGDLSKLCVSCSQPSSA